MQRKILMLITLMFLTFIPVYVLADELEITGSGVAIRTLPGTNSSVLARKNHGATFPLVNDVKVADQGGCPAGWYKIKYDGQEAYVCSTYGRVIKTTIAQDPSAVSECEKEMSAKGFPKEYWSGLCNLKINHPNWTFNAINTGLDFKTVVDNESSCGTNTIYQKTANPDYIDLSCKGKYDSGYVSVSKTGVAYYMNPANFFSEKDIFMFESNYANPNIGDDVYTKMTSSILDSRMLGFLPMLNSTINTVARTHGINPMMISSRIRQELGSGIATSDKYKDLLLSCISGNYTTRWNVYDEDGSSFDYYYNFFNIGVGDGSNDSAPLKAVRAAKRRGWGGTGNQTEDIRRAIDGGATFLKNNYILAGQDNIYFQKFNTHPTKSSSLYTHQYMTNIVAPLSEAAIAYNAYKKQGLLASSFVFNIPVYSNIDAPINNTPSGPSDSGGSNSSGGMSVETIITSSGLKLNGVNITGLSPSMTLNDLNNKINALGGKVNSTNLNTKIGTGVKVKITNDSETKEYTLIVKGDTSGDGEINALDLLQVQKNILGINKFSDSQKLAADASNDGEINALDLLKIQKNILGISKIEQ